MADRNPQVFETAFDTYTVVGILGEGGAGRVFEVVDTAEKKFAIKCLRPDLASSEKRKRFKNEVAFCARTDHPNIVRVLGSGVVDWASRRAPFYVMPLYEGSLEDDITQGRINAENALRAFDQILSGVDAAHRMGVTHRDLKPANILRDQTGAYVVADFGIALFEEDQIATAVETKPGTKLLNILYAAPEQRQRGAQVDHRADIYALGLMLNELFTRRVPDGTAHQTIVGAAPAFAYLDGLVDTMRRQAPEERPQSVDAIKRELLARGNDFVRLQQLEEKRREITPAFSPAAVEPIEIMGANWSGSVVIITLNRAPEPDWIQTFTSTRNNSYRVGLDPYRYQFESTRVRVAAHEEDDAQVAIDQLKRWIPEVGEITRRSREERARREAEELKQQLAAEIAQRERVAIGNSRLRL